jgi:hypothetical protein
MGRSEDYKQCVCTVLTSYGPVCFSLALDFDSLEDLEEKHHAKISYQREGFELEGLKCDLDDLAYELNVSLPLKKVFGIMIVECPAACESHPTDRYLYAEGVV